ncbi:MAG: hypothetical protein WDN24_02500 [Sphingomonas sp.]
MRYILSAIFFSFACCPSAALAQILSAPVQKIGVADVTLSETCKVFSSRTTPTFVGQTLPTAGILTPILGGLLGDVAGAGLNTLAAALETASQERAIGAEGRTNFEFYTLDATKPIVAVPRMGTELKCLSIEVPGEHISDADGRANWPPAGYDVNGTEVRARTADGTLTEEQIEELEESFVLTAPLALRIEAEIVLLRDGFYIRPVYIHYATRLNGAPANKALPAELHVELATPSSVKDGSAAEAVFAIARIPLPKLKPGDTWWAEQITSQSGLLPFRADEGATAALKLVLASAESRSKAQEDLAAAEVQIAHAIGVRYDGKKILGCVEIKCPAYLSSFGTLTSGTLVSLVDWAKRPASKLPADTLKALGEAEKAYAAKVLTIDQSFSRLGALGALQKPKAGSTTIEARVVLTRNANKFGLAVAAALKKQEAPLAAAVTGAITKDDPKWTQAKSDLAIAKLTVTHREQALERAKSAGDPEAIEKAELALLEAKLDVNLKAAALDAAIPYPDVGR